MFSWLKRFQQARPKPANYAEKTLAAYALGMKAGGSINGVRIETGPNCCAAAAALPPGMVYLPEDAPHLPLTDCPHGNTCQCVYRPVMAYEGEARP